MAGIDEKTAMYVDDFHEEEARRYLVYRPGRGGIDAGVINFVGKQGLWHFVPTEVSGVNEPGTLSEIAVTVFAH